MSEKQQNMDELKLSDFLFSPQVSLWQRQLFSFFVVMDSSVTLKHLPDDHQSCIVISLASSRSHSNSNGWNSF